MNKPWHQMHAESMSPGDRIADRCATFIGSWRFIIIANFFVVLWVLFNLDYVYQWIAFDKYPFILLNLVFSWAAFNSTPLIMMSQNRQSDRDRLQASADYWTNVEAKKEIESLQKDLSRMEVEKLDKALKRLDQIYTYAKLLVKKAK